MGLSEAEINKLLAGNAERTARLVELLGNPYLLDQLYAGCCSFAAINMILLRYNEGDFLSKYLTAILQIHKNHGTFLDAAMERYEHFEPFKNKDQKKHEMDFVLNLGLLTMFKRWCKTNDQHLLAENVEYSGKFGATHTDKFKDLRAALPVDGDLYLKQGDMANCWAGLQKAFEIAIGHGGKKVAFTTTDILDGYTKAKKGGAVALADLKGTAYKQHADKAISDARDWAREWFYTGQRFLIAGVFVNSQQTELRKPGSLVKKFNDTARWDHVTHYVVIPRASNLVRGTNFLASWGEKKAWAEGAPGESLFVPIKILRATIK